MTEGNQQELYQKYVRDIAGLSKLNLSEERIAELAPVVKDYFDGVEALNVLDFTGVEPATIFLMRPMERR